MAVVCEADACAGTVGAAAAADCHAARLVQKNQIEIAVVIRLSTAQLAEREHDGLAAVAFAVSISLPMLPDNFVAELFVARPADRRCSKFFVQPSIFAGGDLLETGFGNVGECRVGFADVVLSQYVANAHPQMLGIFETVQNGVDILGPFAQFG